MRQAHSQSLERIAEARAQARHDRSRLTHTPSPRARAGTLALLEEREGGAATLDKAGEVADRDGATLRLKEGGAFYAPSALVCVAVHWPRLVAGGRLGELYHLEVEG